jgi:Tfp pilus assembly protein PilF
VKESNLSRYSIIILSIIMLSGCATFSPPEIRPSTPRENASLQLTQEGIRHLNAGKPDHAIRSFEQAIGLNPNNGECYYYLAQAWLAKGVAPEAKQFNSLAQDYLRDDAQWENRVLEQTQRIEKLSQ